MTKNNLLLTTIIALLVGGLGFFGGIQYQKSQQGTFSRGANQGFPNGINRQGSNTRLRNGMGRPVSGEITKMDESTLTVKTLDGGSKIVIYSSSTKVNKMSESSTSDLKVGEEVTVLGSENPEGTVTAQSISLGKGLFQGTPGNTVQPSVEKSPETSTNQ